LRRISGRVDFRHSRTYKSRLQYSNVPHTNISGKLWRTIPVSIIIQYLDQSEYRMVEHSKDPSHLDDEDFTLCVAVKNLRQLLQDDDCKSISQC